MTVTIQSYTEEQAADLRETLIDVYADVYAEALRAEEPFASIDRFSRGLEGWSSRPGWTCMVAYQEDQAVGFTYGAPLAADAPWWRGLLTEAPTGFTTETGRRTFGLSELMVRVPWRKTGTAKRLHDALLQPRLEERATLLVKQSSPKVHALYRSWGWETVGELRPRIEHAPLFHAMVLPLRTESAPPL